MTTTLKCASTQTDRPLSDPADDPLQAALVARDNCVAQLDMLHVQMKNQRETLKRTRENLAVIVAAVFDAAGCKFLKEDGTIDAYAAARWVATNCG